MSISLMEDIRRSQKDPIGINIYYNKNLNIDGKIKNILCGIEEEEIPFILIPDLEDDAKVLGDRAAKSSKLGVGIGISQTEVTLYHEKLDINKSNKLNFEIMLDNDGMVQQIITFSDTSNGFNKNGKVSTSHNMEINLSELAKEYKMKHIKGNILNPSTDEKIIFNISFE